MKEASEIGPAAEPSGPEFDSDGFPNPAWFPNSRGSTLFFTITGRSRLIGLQATMRALAGELSRRVDRLVNDDTGLQSRYDFVLNFSAAGLNGPTPGVPAEAREPMPDLFQAMQAQLGLKIEEKKGPVEMIVVDRAEKAPTGN